MVGTHADLHRHMRCNQGFHREKAKNFEARALCPMLQPGHAPLQGPDLAVDNLQGKNAAMNCMINPTLKGVAFKDVYARIRTVLANNSFNALTEIDVQAMIKKKLDVEMWPTGSAA